MARLQAEKACSSPRLIDDNQGSLDTCFDNDSEIENQQNRETTRKVNGTNVANGSSNRGRQRKPVDLASEDGAVGCSKTSLPLFNGQRAKNDAMAQVSRHNQQLGRQAMSVHESTVTNMLTTPLEPVDGLSGPLPCDALPIAIATQPLTNGRSDFPAKRRPGRPPKRRRLNTSSRNGPSVDKILSLEPEPATVVDRDKEKELGLLTDVPPNAVGAQKSAEVMGANISLPSNVQKLNKSTIPTTSCDFVNEETEIRNENVEKYDAPEPLDAKLTETFATAEGTAIPTSAGAPSQTKASRTRPNPFKLISCDKYGEEDTVTAPFTVDVSVEALAVVDVHAHCVQTEVIGLLGGHYDSSQRHLILNTAEPCRSITDSTTDLQCEMDPVSQAEAAEKIRASGLSVVGWYHSHPTFVPNPSLRDLETQAKYQELFKEGDMPFIAVILSPYSGSINPVQKQTLPSKFKCLMVSEEINQQGNYRVPYEFLPKIVRKDQLRCNLLERVKTLCAYLDGQKTSFCMIDRIRGKDLLLVNKMAFSIKHYLEKAGLSSKEAETNVDCIRVVVQKHLSTRNK